MAKNSPEVEQGGEKPSESRRLMLLILILMMAVLGYLYFFTSLLKPREEAVKPEASQPSQVKKPLPPRPAEKATAEAEPAATPKLGADKVASAGKTASAVPAAVEKGASAKGSASATSPPTGKEGAGDKKAPAVKPTESQTAKAAAPAVKAGDKPQPVPANDEKTATPPKKHEGESATKPNKPATATAKPAPKKIASEKTAGQFTLLIGEFVPDKQFAVIQAKVRKVVGPSLVTTSLQKVEPMHRLFIGEFPDYESAAAELQKLKPLSSDAFMIEKAGKYQLFAGSYFGTALVEKQKQRLAAKGVNVQVQKAEVSVRVIKLTAGRFASSSDAKKAVEKLRKDGIKASVISRK